MACVVADLFKSSAGRRVAAPLFYSDLNALILFYGWSTPLFTTPLLFNLGDRREMP